MKENQENKDAQNDLIRGKKDTLNEITEAVQKLIFKETGTEIAKYQEEVL